MPSVRYTLRPSRIKSSLGAKNKIARGFNPWILVPNLNPALARELLLKKRHYASKTGQSSV
ncbi:hypothetical protein SAMN04488519_110141 [Algoriphagus ornithinivorans]|uniref:Uncharacterized protein n=1 Tax=Algoriphagus ornithinivorans TaxID=226506 RepID=A0A1I5IZ92_9BACT|nr:hypothetical protein SAMN04488519_110141 [Algoriphagus ornithinivorans]